MANFETPFALTGPRRNPTVDERANGFPCGPADQLLFNGLFHRIESELGALIAFAGLSGSDTDFTQVRQAIQAMIASATGDGDTEQFLLLDQARARLPFFPQWQTPEGTVNVTSPANGVIRLPGNLTLLHRGIFLVTTAQTDFNTAASKTYHLRWSLANGFQLKDLADAAYNPGFVSELDTKFDSTYDDMLIARVVTNAGNVPTITNLVNKATMIDNGLVSKTMTRTPSTAGGGNFAIQFDNIVFNWARTPKFTAVIQRTGLGGVMPAIPEDPAVILNGSTADNSGTVFGVTNRYGLQAAASMDMNAPATPITLGFQLSYTAIAV
jgi:hypothetical protein